MTAMVGTIIRTDVELFDLPQDTVIRIATGGIGEVREPRDEDAPAWAFEDNGERMLPRYIAWAGSDVHTSPHDAPAIMSWMLPAEVIYLPPARS